MLVFVIISLDNKPRLLKLVFNAFILDFINELGVEDVYSF
jgi:hypothetical protein